LGRGGSVDIHTSSVTSRALALGDSGPGVRNRGVLLTIFTLLVQELFHTRGIKPSQEEGAGVAVSGMCTITIDTAFDLANATVRAALSLTREGVRGSRMRFGTNPTIGVI
jgi:hypothetical protein